MTTATAIDIRDIVLSNNTFGPREISQLLSTIAEDYQQFGVLRDGVAELEVREDRSPAAAVRRKSLLSSRGRSNPTASTPALCSASRSKAIAAATTTPR